ncbi:MAG: hypothetical protein K2X39_06145 [Silvanigrellaceae bacterium]|nr:hypothetical protein [Silvanigrellaceae bacterium]
MINANFLNDCNSERINFAFRFTYSDTSFFSGCARVAANFNNMLQTKNDSTDAINRNIDPSNLVSFQNSCNGLVELQNIYQRLYNFTLGEHGGGPDTYEARYSRRDELNDIINKINSGITKINQEIDQFKTELDSLGQSINTTSINISDIPNTKFSQNYIHNPKWPISVVIKGIDNYKLTNKCPSDLLEFVHFGNFGIIGNVMNVYKKRDNKKSQVAITFDLTDATTTKTAIIDCVLYD